MIKFVLDTNVFISGIFWSGAPAKILDSWQENKNPRAYARGIFPI